MVPKEYLVKTLPPDYNGSGYPVEKFMGGIQ
jgi:hypothetical protein